MENDDDIKFEAMPDWGGITLGSNDKSQEMSNTKPQPQPEKEYDSLYEELIEKCNPDNFIKPFVPEKAKVANELYAQLINCKDRKDCSLTAIRDKCIDELGLKISAKKKFDYLGSIFDPQIYTKQVPYDANKVEQAIQYFAKLKENEDDIRALEQLEKEAVEFIKDKEEEDDFEILSGEEYLEKYPTGKYASVIKKQIADYKEFLEKEEDRYYKENGPMAYLRKYPNGNYANDARNKLEDEDFRNCDAKFYLEIYPSGRYAKEAEDYLQMSPKEYLKKYHDGRYKTDAEESIHMNKTLIIAGIVIVSMAVCWYFFNLNTL